MSNYNRVLIPIDLTPGIGPLTPAVRRLIDTNESEITLLHVVESQPWLGRYQPHCEVDDGTRTPGAPPVSRSADFPPHRMGTARGLHLKRDSHRRNGCRPAVRRICADGHKRARTSRRGSVGGSALPGIAGMGDHRTRESGANPAGMLRHRVRWKRGSRFERGGMGSGANGGAAENRVRAANSMAPGRPYFGSRPAGNGKLRCFVRGSRVCATVGRPVPPCKWVSGCRFRCSAVPYGCTARDCSVTGGSREALLAAESECPVLYVGPGNRSRAERPAVFAAGRSA